MVLVTGSTGSFGSLVIEHLITKGIHKNDIAALVRDEEKASKVLPKGIQFRKGNYDNYRTLVEAFKDVDQLMFVSGSEIATREAQHKNVVNAAKEAGVGHVVYTSFMRNNEIKNSGIAFLQNTHIKTENWIKESGITYTIMQNALYADMLPMFIGEKAIENGMIIQPAHDGKISALLRTEMAEAAAEVLVTNGHENATYLLSNPDVVSYNYIARILTDITGKEIKYQSPEVADFEKALKDQNVPDEYVGLFVGFSIAQAQGELALQDPSLEQLLGRKPITIRETLTKIYG
ncbi:SDR family oxidoreductase [Cytophaga sp. FL35]|uniref:SDR family oxidoreductase n=1 Tax=Cytophaga sp. FL35 TaxID=1904456 RepID=UPI001653CFE9|nr:SDR family oxidoreductase [Cytophaga sp. FL35]MBC6998097.1 SDR family oxidoreductase [Cytophaga sp. FL35]